MASSQFLVQQKKGSPSRPWHGRNATRCVKTGERIFYDDYTDPDRIIWGRLGLDMKGWPETKSAPPPRPKRPTRQHSDEDE